MPQPHKHKFIHKIFFQNIPPKISHQYQMGSENNLSLYLVNHHLSIYELINNVILIRIWSHLMNTMVLSTIKVDTTTILVSWYLPPIAQLWTVNNLRSLLTLLHDTSTDRLIVDRGGRPIDLKEIDASHKNRAVYSRVYIEELKIWMYFSWCNCDTKILN